MNYKLTLRDGVTVRDAIGLSGHLTFADEDGKQIVTLERDWIAGPFKIDPIGMPFHVAIQETGKVRRIGWLHGLYVRWGEVAQAYVDKDGIRYTANLNGKDWIPGGG